MKARPGETSQDMLSPSSCEGISYGSALPGKLWKAQRQSVISRVDMRQGNKKR